MAYFTNRPIVALWLLALILTVILGLSSAAAPPPQHHIDKLIHLTVFSGLALLPLVGIARTPLALAAAVMMIPFGIVIELGQALVPGRSASLGDAAANTLGVSAGIMAGWMVRRLRFRHLHAS